MAKKINLSYKDIEANLKELKSDIPASEVGYVILKAFGKGDADIRRYKEGKGVISSFDGVLIKGLFCYKAASTMGLTSTLESLKTNSQILKAAPKIIAVSDGKTLLAYDTREKETYENPIDSVYCDFAFFYPLCNVEKVRVVEENPADVKAAEKMAKLHDEIRAYNRFDSDSDLHDLNIFMARLLFCFFAEDTAIFEDRLFTGSIIRYTNEDGSDLSDYLSDIFNIMDVKERTPETMKIVSQFPYVNGGLFSKHIAIPKMGYRARKLLVECGELNWRDINPDIFGSMIQAVVNPNERANQGMHYTSVPNIMKVINPLFLDELRAEYNKQHEALKSLQRMKEMGGINIQGYYEQAKPITKACNQLLLRMSKMKFFDPACGSGNFLIITYKSMRILEMDILKILQETENLIAFKRDASVISLSQFYGIELDDFAHEIAMLSLWLAEHQMNRKFYDDFGINTDALPLKNITQIVCGNACSIDWDSICPHSQMEEVFIFGNPPYIGGKLQSKEQKADLASILGHLNSFKNLDYISIWFYKASQYIMGTNAQSAFVSTNSICQGEQVSMIWQPIFDMGIEISFAYKSFKWSNNAKHNAGVTVVIIGLCNKVDKKEKRLYSNSQSFKTVVNISPYLTEGRNIIVSPRNTVLGVGMNKMELGNLPLEGGFLNLDPQEKDDLLREYPDAMRFIRPIVGGEEYLNGKSRFCIWIKNEELEEAIKIPVIKDRIERVRHFRENGGDVAKTLVYRSHQFRYMKEARENMIVAPCTSSENREYIPVGFFEAPFIANHSVQCIYDQGLWCLGIISSRMHMTWTKAVGGYLGTSIRYSVQLIYNTFPFPKISSDKKKDIEELSENILITRAMYPSKTLAELYDPEKMPYDLREAHQRLDDIVDSCYAGYPFADDNARLECLFKLYERMTK